MDYGGHEDFNTPLLALAAALGLATAVSGTVLRWARLRGRRARPV